MSVVINSEKTVERSATGDLILLAEDDLSAQRYMEALLRFEGFDVKAVADGASAVAVARETIPDLVILDLSAPGLDGLEVCRRIRHDVVTRNVPVIMAGGGSHYDDKAAAFSAGVDDYVVKPLDPREIVARARVALSRWRMMRAVNPLTGLPGNVQLQDELQRVIADRRPFVLMYADLDNFKAFNDHYGFLRGDDALKAAANCIKEAVGRRGGSGSFIGHVGGDDFVVLVLPDEAEPIAAEIISSWGQVVVDLYDPLDARRGHIEVVDRRDRLQRYPIMGVSIGIASSARRPLTSPGEAAAIAAEMKQVAKRDPRSSYAMDRRRT